MLLVLHTLNHHMNIDQSSEDHRGLPTLPQKGEVEKSLVCDLVGLLVPFGGDLLSAFFHQQFQVELVIPLNTLNGFAESVDDISRQGHGETKALHKRPTLNKNKS